jgi:hypothetical protein
MRHYVFHFNVMIDSSGIHRGEPVCAADKGFPFPPAPLRPQAALMTLPSLDKIKQEEEEKKKKKILNAD